MISRRYFLRFMTGLGAFSASTAAYGFGIEPALRLRVARYHLSPPNWPADFHLKIAVIADLHACDPWMSLEHIEAIVERTNALDADIIVMLGDYVAGHRHVTRFIPAGEWASVLAGLKAPLGVHAILGNHDWWEDKTVQRDGQGTTIARRALEAVGIPVYENDAQRLNKAGRPFWLAGLGDQLAYAPARRFRPVRRIGVDDLAATLKRVPTTRRSFFWRTSPMWPFAYHRASRCNCPVTPLAARCGYWAGRRCHHPDTNSPTATSA
jgi:predicted MPP superfamily phosphohydrolase